MPKKSFWKTVNQLIREADIILEILDSRFVDETRNIEIEDKIKRAGKQLIFVINKCDLVSKDYMDKKPVKVVLEAKLIVRGSA